MGIDRRRFLSSAAAAGATVLATAAQAQDDLLEQLMRQQQSSGFGGGFDAASRTLRMPKATLPTLSAATVETTAQAIPHYEAIVARGGWPQVPPGGRLRVGMRNASVVPLRERLAAGGDLEVESGKSDVFDSYVEQGIRRFQARHGLNVDGAAGEQTLAAMNVPAEARLNQLKVNLVRLRTITRSLPDRFVMCNIPAAHIEAIEGGVAVSRHTAVVGKPDRASPELSSRIIEVNFNPFWTVPVSIVRRDLVPIMQKEPDYLVKNRIRIFDRNNNEVPPGHINWYSQEAVNYRFRQDPGDFNSLGSIRINFHNQHGVYMHDTPLQNLFGEDFRFHSSGCVRVENVRDLVEWLLRDTPNWPRQTIDSTIASGDRINARVANPVPLQWVYVTGWATEDGVVQFRDDIYSRDGLGNFAQRG